MADAAVRVVVYTRQGCHLCDDAIAVVQEVCAQRGEQFVTVDIDADPDLVNAYGMEIPVVTVDGVKIARFRIAPRALIRALKKRRRTR